MKRIILLSVTALLFAVFLVLNFLGIMKSYAVTAALFAAFICIIFLTSFENAKPPAGQVMIIVTVTALASLGRIVFSFLPQIQPVTALVILTGFFFGMRTGTVTGMLCAVISNIFMGQGPWTMWQMIAWGLLGLLFSLLPEKTNRWVLAILAALSAFLYSLITDINTIATLGFAMGKEQIITVFVTGLLFNIRHAAVNLILVPLLYQPFKKASLRLENRYASMMN